MKARLYERRLANKVHTLTSVLYPGKPFSRAKAQTMRDAVAKSPIAANTMAAMTKDV